MAAPKVRRIRPRTLYALKIMFLRCVDQDKSFEIIMPRSLQLTLVSNVESPREGVCKMSAPVWLHEKCRTKHFDTLNNSFHS